MHRALLTSIASGHEHGRTDVLTKNLITFGSYLTLSIAREEQQENHRNGREVGQVKLDMAVHPVADLFPMLPTDELHDLAEDIKLRGQLQPIVLDSDGRILDGRNRFAACKLADVEPKFSTYEGDDPDGYALAVNISRRHMTKGQQAIVVARSCLVSKQKLRDAEAAHGINKARIAQANVILEFATDLADEVLAGGAGATKFDAAYEIAKQRKREKQQRADEADAIREEAPDLAAAVEEESITLAAAKEELQRRQADADRSKRIAPIDALVAESGARTFAARVEAEELTWAEAERLAIEWKKEWLAAAERNKRRIFDILAGWKALTRFLDAPDDSFNTVVLELLGESSFRGDIKKLVSEMAENATRWNGAI